jgi:hypothetical protein
LFGFVTYSKIALLLKVPHAMGVTRPFGAAVATYPPRWKAFAHSGAVVTQGELLSEPTDGSVHPAARLHHSCYEPHLLPADWGFNRRVGVVVRIDLQILQQTNKQTSPPATQFKPSHHVSWLLLPKFSKTGKRFGSEWR